MVNYLDQDLFCKSGRRQRRLMRQAVNLQNRQSLLRLLQQGCDINMSVSEVRGDTLLMYSIRRGSLEMVELLLCFDSCHINKPDRTQKTPLDEAIRLWISTALENSDENKQLLGRRHRILKRLLSAGANIQSLPILHQCIMDTINRNGRAIVEKICKIFSAYGSSRAKGNLIIAVILVKKMTKNIQSLILSGADINIDISGSLNRLSPYHMPLDTVIIILCAIGDNKTVEFINRKVLFDEARMLKEWSTARHVFKLICLLGHKPSPFLISSLFYQEPGIFKWYIQYQRNPPPLKHICRLKVRQNLKPNVLAGASQLIFLPKKLRNYLSFRKQ